MKCQNCGALLNENENFCGNCGAQVVVANQNNLNQQPVNNQVSQMPSNYQNPVSKPANKNKDLFIALGVAGGILVLLILLALAVGGLKDSSSTPENNIFSNYLKEEENKEPKNSMLVANTRWLCGDGSELVLTSNRLDWYQEEGVHNDNYFSAEYKFYIGKDAVKFVTENLSEYGVTKDELQNTFDRNEMYDESNFVVFYINYDKFILDGEEQTITKPISPWFGFILRNNTFLDVANMNTKSYYDFEKQ